MLLQIYALSFITAGTICNNVILLTSNVARSLPNTTENKAQPIDTLVTGQFLSQRFKDGKYTTH